MHREPPCLLPVPPQSFFRAPHLTYTTSVFLGRRVTGAEINFGR
jgi:hypothetical protein